MRRVIASAVICFFATVCSAQEKYSNSQWKFSFTVPEGWEVTTDELVLRNYGKKAENEFGSTEILALCLEGGSAEQKSSITVRAEAIGDPKEGLSMETVHEESLRSNYQWESSNAYLKGFWEDLIKRGEAGGDAEFNRQVYYDPERHIFYETAALPLKKGGAIGISTIRILGSNREAILSFKLYGASVDGLLGVVKGVADSFAYDKQHGFGETPSVDVVKVLWHYLVPGAGTLIVCFILYKWVASEYG